MKRIVTFAALLAAFVGCARQRAQAPNVYAAEQHERIVSLAPSLTEDLFAIGAGGQVVGSSAYSDYPPAARKLPVVDAAGWIDLEKILALHPDFVVGLPSDAARTRNLSRAKVPSFLISNEGYDDIFPGLDELGVLTGRIDATQKLEVRVRARIAALKKQASSFERHPRVFVVLGTSPIDTVGRGSYLDTLLAMAGARNVVRSTLGYPSYSPEQLLADQPDALILAENVKLAPLLSRPPWSELRAVRGGHVYRVPPNLGLQVPGPRVADGLAWLVGVVERMQR